MSFLKNLASKIFSSSPVKDQNTPTNIPHTQKREPIITITDSELTCEYPSANKREQINWKDIISVDVLTTDEGPFVCDVFILIGDDNGGVAIPQDRDECKIVIDRIFTLPNFNFEEFTKAMASADNKTFNVWQKK